MRPTLIKFFHEEAGAVTVDWVVLTGAIVGLGFLVLTPIAFSTGNSATSVAANIVSQPVGYTATP